MSNDEPTYIWGYASSSQATCSGKCGQKMSKGTLRLRVNCDNGVGNFTIVKYRCLDCVTDKQIDNIIAEVGGLDCVEGFDRLDENDELAIAVKAKAHASATYGAGSKQKAAPKTLQQRFLDKVQANSFEAVKVMVDSLPELANVHNSERWSALHQFASAGNAEAVTFLISKGADWKFQSQDGKTALDVAVGEAVAVLEAEHRLRHQQEEMSKVLSRLAATRAKEKHQEEATAEKRRRTALFEAWQQKQRAKKMSAVGESRTEVSANV
eukprot:TRINITY_DN58459_c0_g1_i1.p1 TRINITY_DN58459_c0_g1~~TRINITY_DN58459_c0_g1_i1.p1  ORF type:complete len:267 (+),score=58.15 TRINITY_DN58459_c0_g1_i1:114-914(+)